MSKESIESGQRSMRVIEGELKGTQFGIVALTKANQDAPWINFEAGAMSKVVDEHDTRVSPYLIDFESMAQVAGPLSQFHMKMAHREQTLELVMALGHVVGAKDSTVQSRFEAF